MSHVLYVLTTRPFTTSFIFILFAIPRKLNPIIPEFKYTKSIVKLKAMFRIKYHSITSRFLMIPRSAITGHKSVNSNCDILFVLLFSCLGRPRSNCKRDVCPSARTCQCDIGYYYALVDYCRVSAGNLTES